LISSIKKVQAIIVNWERPQDTIECIRSVECSQGYEISVLIVDNGSRDDSVHQIRQACPQVAVLSLPQNQGFSGGCNAGIESTLDTQAEFIFLLNNDTVIFPETIHHLVTALEQWDVTVPKILFYATPERVWAAGADWRSFPPTVLMTGYEQPDGLRYDMPRSLDYATGCALMVKRQVFETVGGFDLEYENYAEDYDLCYRIRKEGFSIGYVPTARVLHKVSRTLGERSLRKWRYLGRNAVLFYRKHNRFPRWMLWSFLVWVLIREVIKGQAALLPHFWQGVQEGFTVLKRAQVRATR